jgi:hypothetical protein
MADSTQTLLCTYLSAVLLLGLVLNAALGWAWADPIAALVIAAVATREGFQAWRGENCDDCAIPAADSGAAGCTDGCCAGGPGPEAPETEVPPGPPANIRL